MAQLFWEDVKVGMEIPPYPKVITLMELNRFAGANNEFLLIHMDRDYARNVAKLPDIVVMGNLKYAYISNMMIKWIGEGGTLKRLTTQFRHADTPGPALGTEPTIVCKGRVNTKYIQNSDHCVECEVWIDNNEGQTTTTGSAIVSVPSKHA